MPDLDLTQWPTKLEVRNRLNISARTVDRLVAENKLERTSRFSYGRRPVPLYNPSDVERLAQENSVKNTDWLPDQHSASRAALELRREGKVGTKNGHTHTDPQLAALIAEFIQTFRDAVVANSPSPKEIASPAPQVAPVPATLYLSLSDASLYSGLPEGRLRAFVREGKLGSVRGRYGRTMVSRLELENLWRKFSDAKSQDAAFCAALE